MSTKFTLATALALAWLMPLAVALPSTAMPSAAEDPTGGKPSKSSPLKDWKAWESEPPEGWQTSQDDKPLPAKALDEMVLPADEGVELSRLPGKPWSQIDVSGSGTVDLTAEWAAVVGTPMEIRLAPGGSVDDEAPISVRVTTSKASELGAGAMRFDVSRLAAADADSGEESPDAPAGEPLPPVELRASMEDAVEAFGGVWGENLEVQQVAFPDGCRDNLRCAQLAEVGAEMSGAGQAEFVLDATDSLIAATSGDSQQASPGQLTGVIADSGDSYAATPVSTSGEWQVGEGTGEFSYSYPFELPDPLRTGAPDLSLSYSSGSVDAMSLNANGQASAAGIGWGLTQNFISRSYAGCSDDGKQSGELCWKTRDGDLWEDLTINLNGTASELIAVDASGNNFRLRQDPGWRVTRSRNEFPASKNADNDKETFKVESPDGIVYWFGRSVEAGSVWTVPVRGNNKGEPCYQGDGNGVCLQAWQWNLDRVVDTHNNLVTYGYATETNYYNRPNLSDSFAPKPKPSPASPMIVPTKPNPPIPVPAPNIAYDAAGRLTEISYGSRDGEGSPRGRVRIESLPRCAPKAGEKDDARWACPDLVGQPGEATARFVDTPLQLRCFARKSCAQYGPTFFSTFRYAAVISETRGPDNEWQPVDRWELRHSFPDGSEGQIVEPHLWLESIQRFGKDGRWEDPDSPQVAQGDGSTPLPPVTFGRTMLNNRVAPPVNGRTLTKPRMSRIGTELGGQVFVTYGHQKPCTRQSVEGVARWNPPGDCFAQHYQGGFEWFHKYLVKRVGRSDKALGYQPTPATGNGDGKGGPSILGEWQVTDYEYVGNPGWRFMDNRTLPIDRESWDDWRGYEKTRVTQRKSESRQLTGAHSVREVVRYRGMSENLASPGKPGPATFLHTTEFGNADNEPEDTRYMQGQTAETTVLNPAGVGLKRNYTGYLTLNTGQSPFFDGRQSRMVLADEQLHYTTLFNEDSAGEVVGDTRRAVSTTFHDGGGSHRGILAGAPLSVQDSSYRILSTCSETSWKSSVSDKIWLRAPATSRTARGACWNPDRVLEAESKSFYDGDSPGNSAPLVRGDLTLERTALSAGEWADDSYGYDRFGRTTTTTTDAKNNTTTTAYTPTTVQPIKNLTVTNAKGHVVSTDFSMGRVLPTEVTDANGESTLLRYDRLGRLVNVMPPNTVPQLRSGQAIVFRYDVAPDSDRPMRVATIKGPYGSPSERSFAYFDGWGRPIEKQVETEWRSDWTPPGEEPWQPHFGRLVSVTGYDSAGQVAHDMPAVPNDDEAGSGVVNPDNAWWLRHTQTEYDALARPTKVTSTYDSGERGPQQSAAGADSDRLSVTKYRYLGDRTITQAPARGWTQTLENARGQVTEVDRYDTASLEGDSLGASYTYTATGNLRSISSEVAKNPGPDCGDSCDTTGWANWTYSYDLAGRRIRSVDPDTGTSTSTFDKSGNEIRSTDGAGRVLATAYDELSRPLNVRDGANRLLVQHTYDTGVPNAKGRLVSSVRHNYFQGGTDHRVTTDVSGYDDRGNATGTSSTYATTMELNKAAAGPQTVEQSFAYNFEDRLESVEVGAVGDLPSTELSYGYNSVGQIESVDGGGGDQAASWARLATAFYDRQSQPILLASGQEGSLMIRRYAWGRSTGQLHAMSAQSSVLAADGESLETQPGGRELRYGYDKVGNVTRTWGGEPSTAKSTAWCYGYDGFSRLTRAYTASANEDYSCNAAGDNDRSLSQATYDISYDYKENQLANVGVSYQGPDDAASSAGSATYEYSDPEHAHAPTVVPHGIVPTDADRKSAQYDGSGAIAELKDAEGSGAATETFKYDAFGRYSTVTTAEDTEEYVYDASGMRVALLTDGSEGKKSTVTLGPVTIVDGKATLRAAMPDGTALGTLNAEGWTFDWSDVQGNVRYRASERGVENLEYLPEGAIIDANSVKPGDRGFLGKTQDSPYEVQLDHRKLSTLYRTFLNPDPLLAPLDPQTLNPYSYSAYNPISKSDPSGMGPVGGDGIPIGSGLTCEKTGACEVSDEPPPGTVQVPITPGDNPDCNGYSTVCDGISYPTQNYGAANNAYYLNDRGQFTAYHDPNYVPEEYSWREFGKGLAVGTANFLILDAINSCKAMEPMCAVELAAVVFKPLKGAKYADDVFRAATKSRRAGKTAAKVCSFSGTTVVLMADGTKKPIEDIKVGDQVMATDPETGEQFAKTVEHVWVHDDSLFDLVTEDETITTTEDHPFWSVTDQKFERADQLAEGEKVLGADFRTVTVSGLRLKTEHEALAYNLSIEGVHTYHVGYSEILVHNDCSDEAWDIAMKSFDKHGVQMGFKSVDEMGDYVDRVMKGSRGTLRDDGSRFWVDHGNSTIIFRGPNAGVPGSVYRPDNFAKAVRDATVRSVPEP